jgi:hypothetical protein
MISALFVLTAEVDQSEQARDSRGRQRCVQLAKEEGIAPDSEAVERYSR